MINIFKQLNVWSLHWATTKWGALALFLCAFADACVLPLPTPMFFMILTLLNRSNYLKNVLYATIGSLLGSIVGYAIGHYAWLNTNGTFTLFAQFIFDHVPGFSETNYLNLLGQFAKWDFWILFVASFIPVPYKIFSISSGVFDMNIYMFLLATLVSQGIKFYCMAFLIIKIGPKVKTLFAFKFKYLLTKGATFVRRLFVSLKKVQSCKR